MTILTTSMTRPPLYAILVPRPAHQEPALDRTGAIIYIVDVTTNGGSNGRTDHAIPGQSGIQNQAYHTKRLGLARQNRRPGNMGRIEPSLLSRQAQRRITILKQSPQKRPTNQIGYLTYSKVGLIIKSLNETRGLGATNSTASLNAGKDKFPMFLSQNSSTSSTEQPAQPKFIRATELPMRVTVTNPDDFCFFNHDYFKAFPVKTGDTVTVIARGAGMFSWYTFVLDGDAGQGKPSGIAHINGFSAAEGK